MVADQAPFDPRFDPAFQPGFRGAETASEAGPLGPEDGNGGSRTEAASTVAPFELSDSPSTPLAGNPWVRVLWIVASLFSVGGIAAMAWSESAQIDRESAAAALILPVVVAGVAPWFVLTGLAAGVGVAILAAVRWRPSR